MSPRQYLLAKATPSASRYASSTAALSVGAAAVMPLGSPIGSNRGIRTRDMIEIIVEQSHVPVVVDAGIGLPSHAAEAIELGADAVLIGETLMRAPDKAAKLAELKGAL